MSIKLIISGCCGRMGRSIATLALADSVFTIGAALEASGHEAIGHDYGTVLGRSDTLRVPVVDDPRDAIKRGEVLIEFTVPAVTVKHAQLAQELR
ncbi:MAG: 4-hydroxy-tetrahydrodipicolinate reductase, partial [Candidatus Omnitrophota bacterium]|nr:4-hydroxy-tetrahydrodipicolinate reductase [Candidatus Omnitrophota bacterium]